MAMGIERKSRKSEFEHLALGLGSEHSRCIGLDDHCVPKDDRGQCDSEMDTVTNPTIGQGPPHTPSPGGEKVYK